MKQESPYATMRGLTQKDAEKFIETLAMQEFDRICLVRLMMRGDTMLKEDAKQAKEALANLILKLVNK